MTTTREQFMGSVRKALGRSGPLRDVPTPPEVDDALVRLTKRDEPLLELFIERAEAVGMKVRRTTAGGLATQLLDVLRSIDAQSVTLALGSPEDDAPIHAALGSSGVEVRAWDHVRSMEPHYEVDAGITCVHAAIAETGSLVCCSGPCNGRGHSLVPPVHIAVVRKSDIVPDIMDLVTDPRRAESPMPSAVALITGPSKTADIEGVLITGVHGPGRVFILLVEDS